VPQGSADFACTFRSNLSVILTSCRLVQLGLDVDSLQVQGDDLRRGREALGHQGLGEPRGVVVEATLDAGATVSGLVDNEGGGLIRPLAKTERRAVVEITYRSVGVSI
jgi:hypothetical protein